MGRVCINDHRPEHSLGDESWLNGCAQCEVERLRAALLATMEMRSALELIAAPPRPDGTWNRDREACRQMAVEALGRHED